MASLTAERAALAAVNGLVKWAHWSMCHGAPVVVTTRYGTTYPPARVVEKKGRERAHNGTTVAIVLDTGMELHVGDLAKITTVEG